MKFPLPRWRSPSASPASSDTATTAGLGAFGGVYTPSILTILGVIMYLRFGWVVGNVGLLGTLVIVTLSTSITFLTSLSVCAIATDRVVRVGGAYYMVSRALGIETGGAVGIPLYFAQALSVALYTIGFAESVTLSFGNLNLTLVALVTTLAVAVLALTSAEAAIKAQYAIMAAIALSLILLVFGHPLDPTETTSAVAVGVTETTSFWRVFAVFFPAVTGIMAGINLSGDLKDPSRAIPLGTLAAVATGYVIYLIVPIVLAARVDTATLIADSLVMRRIAAWGPAILLGVWGATLSSAIGSLLGAPRVLQALARDGVLPRWMRILGTGSGPNDEPRIGTMVTLGVALAAVSIGDLNAIAPVLTMFFLTTYLVLNVAAGIEGFVQSPSFRPTFPVAWWLSLLGAVGCIIVMLAIDPAATVVAATIVLVIYFWLQQRSLIATWGDARNGLRLALLREGIFQLDPAAEDPRSWRPNILALTGTPKKRWALVEFADALVHNRGFITIASILPSGSRDAAQKTNMESTIRDYLEKRGVQALVRVIAAPDPLDGALQLVEAYGIGPLVPNTVVLGANGEPDRRERYCQTIADIHWAGRSVVVLRENEARGFGRRQKIDVWWRGLQGNGALMLLLADLLRNDVAWRNAEICLNLVVADENAAQSAAANLADLIRQLRVSRARSQVVVAEGRSFDTILAETSRHADLVFLGMAQPDESFAERYTELEERAAQLPTTVFVLADPDFAFQDILSAQ
ncbi:amino acid permease [Synechococcus sp. PCC 7336]|uniref:amino acid permease n=1 Tax=Synechococcus sp. PCC 7336 TaxID=195250 RepID=UPI000346E880|nr:amino acid permease [Synechococcus sp. PCC 7336]